MSNLVTNMFGAEGVPGSAPGTAPDASSPTESISVEASAASLQPVTGGFEQILNSAQQFAMNMNTQNPEFVAQMRERMSLSNIRKK